MFRDRSASSSCRSRCPHVEERYRSRPDHFTKVYSSLIAPAVDLAGLQPKGPTRSGTENIQAAIINDLQGAELVLADLSALNPNVFLELGIRSALDLPVCLVWDGLDVLPFDSSTLNTHRYDPLPIYELNDEIRKMAAFIEETVKKSDGRNELWRFFGTASKSLPTAELDPEDATITAKLDLLLDLVEHQRSEVRSLSASRKIDDPVGELISVVGDALTRAGSAGLHGSDVRAICHSILGDGLHDFLDGESLSSRLSQLGVQIRTNDSGRFFDAQAPRLDSARSQISPSSRGRTAYPPRGPVLSPAMTRRPIPPPRSSTTPPPSRIRIYELARELGLTNKEALDLSLALGISATSHSSSIPDAQADRVRRAAQRKGPVPRPAPENGPS